MKPTLILLHGLFGSLSNWKYVIEHFNDEYSIHTPALPILDESKGNKLDFMVEFLHDYVQQNNISEFTLIGNSLGGHIAVLYTYKYPNNVKSLILTGSSGLYENSMLDRFPRRNDYQYIKDRVEYTFYNPKTAAESLVNEVFKIVTNNVQCFQIIKTAKTAQRNYVTEELQKIDIPVLLIWGNQDKITPPNVATEFHHLLKNSELYFIDECGHAPMMEQPEIFNMNVSKFLDNLKI